METGFRHGHHRSTGRSSGGSLSPQRHRAKAGRLMIRSRMTFGQRGLNSRVALGVSVRSSELFEGVMLPSSRKHRQSETRRPLRRNPGLSCSSAPVGWRFLPSATTAECLRQCPGSRFLHRLRGTAIHRLTLTDQFPVGASFVDTLGSCSKGVGLTLSPHAARL